MKNAGCALLHDEVQEIQAGTRDFASLLRCACLIETAQGAEAAVSMAAEYRQRDTCRTLLLAAGRRRP